MGAWSKTCAICGKDEAYYDTHKQETVCCNGACRAVVPDNVLEKLTAETAAREAADNEVIQLRAWLVECANAARRQHAYVLADYIAKGPGSAALSAGRAQTGGED